MRYPALEYQPGIAAEQLSPLAPPREPRTAPADPQAPTRQLPPADLTPRPPYQCTIVVVSFETYIGAASGAHVLRGGELVPLGLAGERISAIHASRDAGTTTVLAGSYGNGLFRSADDGRSGRGSRPD